MGLKRAVIRWVLIGIAAFGLGTATADDVYARTIICGNNLCTVGDQPNWDRMCWEVKNKKKNKCSYYCQGVTEVPSDCRNKDKYECKRTPNSRKNCELENNGYPIDPRNKPEKYKYYTEAEYSKYELEHLPDCKSGKAGEQVCKCFKKTVCQKGQACRKMQMIQTHLETGTGPMVDYTCEYLNDATNSNMTAHNSVSATDGYEAQKQIDANTDSLNGDNGCKTIAQYLERYTSGCWSCMVVSKLTEAFLSAASSGMKITEDAGKKLLMLGFAIWLAFWALKNVSSFTEIKGGNVLNDLLKTAAKVVLAWICINAGVSLIQSFIIQPIMGVGSEIAQVFWSDKTINPKGSNIKDEIEPFNWEDTFEPADADLEDEVNAMVADGLGGGTSDEDPDGDGVVDEPAQVSKDDYEQIVINLQAAFLKILQSQYNEIIKSCKGGGYKSCEGVGSSSGSCNSGCRHKSCGDPGHQNYVKKIMNWAGGGSVVDHYCQASITAAMNRLHQLVGGRVTELLKSAGVNCQRGQIAGGSNVTPNIQLCKNGVQVYRNINMADTIYYHNVINKSGVKKTVGGASGYHAVTYLGGSVISFNGDSVGPMCTSYYYNVTGRVFCLSCLLRAELKNNGLGNLDVEKLAALAGDVGQSYINYEGGKFVDASSESEMENIVKIDDIKYHGKTDIIPKSVINSMLGATKVITDNTAQMMVLGNMAMCYSTMKGGGAWTILKLGKVHISITNIFMWLDGAIIWLLGFVLTCIIAYYLVDMSFKIGLAVLAFPLMMGLWPFKVTQGKLAETIAIIAKSAATFAFLAITTYYAIELLAASLGGKDGLQGIYNEYDSIVNNTVQGDERDDIIDKLDNYFHLFSAGFLLMLFGCIYGYKLIRKTTDDLADKFYSDSTFGSQTPMHNRMTGMASMANKLNQKWGTGLAKDMAANKVGQGLKNVAGRGVTAAKSAGRSVAGGVRSTANKLLGKDGS